VFAVEYEVQERGVPRNVARSYPIFIYATLTAVYDVAVKTKCASTKTRCWGVKQVLETDRVSKMSEGC